MPQRARRRCAPRWRNVRIIPSGPCHASPTSSLFPIPQISFFYLRRLTTGSWRVPHSSRRLRRLGSYALRLQPFFSSSGVFLVLCIGHDLVGEAVRHIFVLDKRLLACDGLFGESLLSTFYSVPAMLSLLPLTFVPATQSSDRIKTSPLHFKRSQRSQESFLILGFSSSKSDNVKLTTANSCYPILPAKYSTKIPNMIRYTANGPNPRFLT